MSAIKDLYTVDDSTKWYSVNVKKVKPDQIDQVASKCLYDARMERLKSASLVVLTGAAALGDKLVVLAFALIAFQVASLFVPFVAFPAMIIPVPELYEMVVSIGELAGGLALLGLFMGYTERLSSKETGYAEKFYTQAKASWDYSNHLYNQQALVLQKA